MQFDVYFLSTIPTNQTKSWQLVSEEVVDFGFIFLIFVKHPLWKHISTGNAVTMGTIGSSTSKGCTIFLLIIYPVLS